MGDDEANVTTDIRMTQQNVLSSLINIKSGRSSGAGNVSSELLKVGV